MDTIDRINAILKEKGMTGADLSRQIGVSTAVYSQWNRKKTKPSNKNVAKAAEILGVPVSELIEQKEPPQSPDEAVGPNKRALLDVIDKMSEAEMILLLERAKRIIESRG